LGKVAEKKIKVVGDFEGPAFNLKNFVDGDRVGTKSVVLNGALADATGITALKINNQVLAYNKEREVEFAMAVDLKEGANQILLAATDVAGNTTTGELSLTYMPQLAFNTQECVPVRAELGEPIMLAFSGTVVSDAGSGLYTAAKSKAAFRLRFKDLTETQTVYYDTLFVDGNATGTHNIESVMINGEPLLIVPGRTVYFNQLMELQEGENTLTIEVGDNQGNTSSKTVTVIRKVPKVHQIGSRMSLAVLPFEIKGQASMASDVVYDNLIDAFIEQDRFHIVSRGDDLEAVLREQKLSQTDLVDKSTAVRVGQLVAAEGIIMGTVRETDNAIEIYARLINTETSTILEAKDVYSQEKDLAQIQYLTNGLALKLKHSFPLIEGMVIQAKGNDIYADFGSFNNIKKEMRFIVFRKGETIVHPITGKVLGSESEELGVATVVKVFEDMSIGQLIADFDASKIQVKDLIITK
jgi:TolB-like protein